METVVEPVFAEPMALFQRQQQIGSGQKQETADNQRVALQIAAKPHEWHKVDT
jgi:hypothetical protein